MLYRTLLKANLKQHKAGLLGIFLLTLLVAAALGTVLTVWTNAESYVRDEMQRAGKNVVFTVKGFYEDPFMGSSMIGMKGFLICETDRDAILHILQNACSGLVLAFVLVLVFVVMVVLGHSISSTVETDYRNMGILKTVGLTSSELRYIQLLQYLIGILAGMICSVPPALLFGGFIIVRTGKIGHITPMKAIYRETEKIERDFAKRIPAFGKGIYFRLAFRQLDTAKRRCTGAFIVALLLVFFASLVGRMDAWLGRMAKA